MVRQLQIYILVYYSCLYDKHGKTWQNLQEKRCDEEISDTSDILCTCERDDGTPSPGPAPTPVTTTAAPTTSAPPAPPGPPAPTPTPAPAECWAELPDLATEEGQSVGEVPRGASVSACRRRCDENAECKSISFCPESRLCFEIFISYFM